MSLDIINLDVHKFRIAVMKNLNCKIKQALDVNPERMKKAIEAVSTIQDYVMETMKMIEKIKDELREKIVQYEKNIESLQDTWIEIDRLNNSLYSIKIAKLTDDKLDTGVKNDTDNT